MESPNWKSWSNDITLAALHLPSANYAHFNKGNNWRFPVAIVTFADGKSVHFLRNAAEVFGQRKLRIRFDSGIEVSFGQRDAEFL